MLVTRDADLDVDKGGEFLTGGCRSGWFKGGFTSSYSHKFWTSSRKCCERSYSYHFFWANQWKTNIKIFSWIQCEISKDRRDYHILGDTNHRIIMHNLNHKIWTLLKNVSFSVLYKFNQAIHYPFTYIVMKVQLSRKVIISILLIDTDTDPFLQCSYTLILFAIRPM